MIKDNSLTFSKSMASDDLKLTSVWLEDIGLPPNLPDTPLEHADVVIVGSGYTGLNAAIETARGGRKTMVLDAQDPGWGCSTRNGGQISTSIKSDLQDLATIYGESTARAICGEGLNALQWIEEFIGNENIDCHFQHCGLFHAAHSPRHFDKLVDRANMPENGQDAIIIPREQQRSEIGSDAYFGGVVAPHNACVHPAKYHRGLLQSALDAGVHVTGHCNVFHIEQDSSGFTLSTSKGRIRAKDVVVATNGYTSGLIPWLDRRIIPIGSYVIATEILPEELVRELIPNGRNITDTRKVVYYYRPTFDNQRIVFGGRVSATESDPHITGPLLYREMCRIFPQLADYKFTHSWFGMVAYTFDELPQTGIHNGIHYAHGYCGSGVSMAGYLGMRLGQKILGKADGNTVFDTIKNPTRPFYTGKPWFLPAVVAWYRWRDQMQMRKAYARDND